MSTHRKTRWKTKVDAVLAFLELDVNDELVHEVRTQLRYFFRVDVLQEQVLSRQKRSISLLTHFEHLMQEAFDRRRKTFDACKQSDRVSRKKKQFEAECTEYTTDFSVFSGQNYKQLTPVEVCEICSAFTVEELLLRVSALTTFFSLSVEDCLAVDMNHQRLTIVARGFLPPKVSSNREVPLTVIISSNASTCPPHTPTENPTPLEVDSPPFLLDLPTPEIPVVVPNPLPAPIPPVTTRKSPSPELTYISDSEEDSLESSPKRKRSLSEVDCSPPKQLPRY